MTPTLTTSLVSTFDKSLLPLRQQFVSRSPFTLFYFHLPQPVYLHPDWTRENRTISLSFLFYFSSFFRLPFFSLLNLCPGALHCKPLFWSGTFYCLLFLLTLSFVRFTFLNIYTVGPGTGGHVSR